MTRKAYLFTGVLCFSMAGQLRADPGPMQLWYSTPATSWVMEPLPVGNGKLAAMVFGGVGTEQIQFNEDTIWTGQPHDYSHPNGANYLSQMQTYIFAKNQSAFWTLCSANFMSVPVREAAYQPVGVLSFTFPHSGLSNYKRSLDLNTATVAVRYDFGGVTYNREVFASAPSNKVIIVRLTASQAAKISFSCMFSTLQTATISTSGNDLIMHARVTGLGDSRYFNTGLTNAIQYDARVRVLAEGGTVTTTSSSVSVTNADTVTLLLSVASNFINYNELGANYPVVCSNNIAAAAANTYTGLRQTQLTDYQALFQRVVLDLGGTTQTNLDTGTRKKQVSLGNDPQFAALLFQMGRYLMISGSRPGSQALNLQGKWNETTTPSWDSKMTLNINEEMNYWGAEVANLSECHLPLFDMIADLSVSGARVAKTNYNAEGWVAHHNTDLWRGAAPVNGVDGVWLTGGAWLCQHLWWHYQFTGDTNFLANTAYPLMKGAAQFFEDFLVPHPFHPEWLVTNPSYSPEHDQPGNGPNVAAPTMDNDLIRDLFNNVIEASQILGVDATFRTNVMALRDKLPPDQIGAGGQLQEWLEDGDDPGHRHCSHLVGFFPGEEISPFYTPALADAARVSVVNRGTGVSGAARIGWGEAWRINLRDRLLDGDAAYLCLTNLITDSKYSTNLVFHDNPNRQVDAVFGTLSGIAEMFLQSQSGEVFLLPALPSKWTNGSVSGLCARGGFQVDIQWQSNKLVSANILSKLGNACRLRSKWPIDVKLGSNYVDAPMVLPGLYQFSTVAGSNYTVVRANVAETENLPAATSGDAHQIVTNGAFSNVRGTLLSANAPGDFVTYTVTNLSAGNYRVTVGANAGMNRARFQLACGSGGGALTNVGPVQDTWSATNVVYLLPINLYTPTNIILLWTNMLKEFDCGIWQSPSNGNYSFRFTVVDKNAGSSGYALSFDYLKFTPATNSSPPLANSAPTDVSLSVVTVTESEPAGTPVGALSTTDPDTGNTFTYTLVNGEGSEGNDFFVVSGSTLQTAAAFNFEAQNSYNVRVRSTDQGGLFFEKSFTVTVLNTNEAPTDISLSNASVLENQPAGTIVGLLGTSDPDAGDTFTYSLVPGTGSDSNSFFTVNGPPIRIIGPFDGDSQNTTVSIRVRSTDAGGLFTEKAFIITVLNTNEAPFAPANVTPADGAVDQPLTPTLQVSNFSDPDNGDTNSAAQWLVRRVADSIIVFDSGEDSTNKTSLAVPSGVLDFVTTYNWQARHEDSHNLWSDYSTPTAFLTVAPSLAATAENGELVISWPTNSTDFSLEYATDLPATNWFPVSPTPAIVNGLNVVTNIMDGAKTFYRLNKQ
jgi:alpha-L-fucosidase 2